MQRGSEKEGKKLYRKNFLLDRLNKNLNDFNDKVNNEQNKQNMDDAVRKVLASKLQNEDKFKENTKN